MRNTLILAAALVASAAAQPAVERSTTWQDTVKRGEMIRQVRGLGEIDGPRQATIQVAETQIRDVRKGQPVTLETRSRQILAGVVLSVGSTAQNGVIAVQVALKPPATPAAGTQIDATIEIERLPDVMMVGRPVMARAQSEGALFKVDGDGQHASRVRVRFGRSSVNTIEVVEGLQPGDRVILSDTSAFDRHERIALR
jgi:HlyD family secretion protein